MMPYAEFTAGLSRQIKRTSPFAPRSSPESVDKHYQVQ
jgi:hypothetical protein